MPPRFTKYSYNIEWWAIDRHTGSACFYNGRSSDIDLSNHIFIITNLQTTQIFIARIDVGPLSLWLFIRHHFCTLQMNNHISSTFFVFFVSLCFFTNVVGFFFFRTGQEQDIDNVREFCRVNDLADGNLCSQILYGSVRSGLVNEITDVQFESDNEYTKNGQSSQSVTAFLEQLPRTGYDSRLRPFLRGKTINVECSMYIAGISSVSESTMDFTADIYLRQSWTDHRLKWNSTDIINPHESLSIGGDVSLSIVFAFPNF